MKYLNALNTLKIAIELYKSEPNKLRHFITGVEQHIANEKIINAIRCYNLNDALMYIDNELVNLTPFPKHYYLEDLETFDLDESTPLNIDEIKELLRINTLELKTVKDIEGNELSYCQYWNNERRISVALEKALLPKIKSDRSILLDLSHKVKNAKQGFYHRFTIKEHVPPVVYNFEMEDEMDEYYNSDYEKYCGYNSWSDDAIDNAFNGDPEMTWNVD